jgi:hypothetical protein
VKNPLFGRRLLLTFNIHIMVFQLKTPNDEKINVEHVHDGKKYLTHYKLNQVRENNCISQFSPKFSGASWCDRAAATKLCRATALKITLSKEITFSSTTTSRH